MLLTFELNDLKKIDFVNNPMTAKTLYETYKPTAFINACLYDMTTSNNITKVEDENKSHGYLFSDEGIGIFVDNNLVWTTYETARKDTTIKDFIAGSPTLVVAGKVNIDWGNKVSTAIQGKAYRSAIGFNQSTLFMYVSDNKITLDELAKYMSEIGCQYAINLDGGGSCHLQEGSTVYRNSTRKNASWFMIYEKDKTVLTIDSKTIVINGVPKQYDVAPFIKNNRTFVPVSFLRDIGFNVEWNARTRQVKIYKQ